MMSLRNFEHLASQRAELCISIYIPTHRFSKEGNEEDRIRFKDRVKAVRDELKAHHGKKDDEVRELLAPAHELLDDEMFWHHTGEGLAFFRSPKETRVFSMPLSFEDRHSISDRYFLHPIFPFFNGDGRFYVLGISEKMVKLWEGSRHRIRPVPIGDDLPSNMEEVVGSDHEEKSLQERSYQSGGGTEKIRHGHGEGRDEEKVEHEKFFREVDRRLSEMIHDEHVPLVFAGVEHYYGHYRKIAHYRQLENDGFIKGNPEQLTDQEVHQKGWEIVKKRFDEDRDHYISEYQDSMGGGKAVHDKAEVVQAAFDGRVEALFIKEGARIPGNFDEKNREVRFGNRNGDPEEDLVERAAMATYEHDGRVFILPEDRMPETGPELNALLRY